MAARRGTFPLKRLDVDGLSIEVEKKRIKNLYLRVRRPDGTVCVSAPKTMPDAAIVRFVRTRMGWIERQRAATAAARENSADSDGPSVTLSGRVYPLVVSYGAGKPRAAVCGDTVAMTLPPDGDPATARKTALVGLYRASLEARAPALLLAWAGCMGVSPGPLTLRDMTTRYGTCNTRTGRITLNLRLARYAPAFLEYVVVHELAHLIEPGHNARFYAVLDRYLPAWRTLRKQLKSLPL